MKIIVADDLPASALELLQADGWIVDARTGRPPDVLARDLADADGLLVRSATKVDAHLLAAAPRLRIVARAGTGVDNVDVGAATRRGIVVANAPLRVPADPLIELVVCPGFGAADDWIAEQAGPGDIAITADIPLAARVFAATLIRV